MANSIRSSVSVFRGLTVHLTAFCRMIPGVLLIVAMVFQPESPRWLVEHEQYERAATVLAHTSGKSVDDPTVVETLEEIKQEFVGKKLPIFQQVWRMGESRPIALRCFIASLVMFFQQASEYMRKIE